MLALVVAASSDGERNFESARGRATLLAMFSAKLERRRQFSRQAMLVAATLFVGGIVLIAMWAVRASSMLAAAEADRAPIIIGVLIALACLFALCLLVYGVLRAFGRFASS
jgi:p-aminobenzoyl-glutamate transporter AbgT